ncbi:OLC1v1006665C1 [Oldenlandia corymbosa var. corymbosa]|uniref:OLC1v1006665C1 n=1 Tax=Oldenlandia corymbosa var. corymbosa TaxID=529605 RepID=A0AAV1DKY1_OLDCO|nr:OLC1v1006665C1 [Oldenlandia corymbosa var. corymbosa]
MSGFARIKRVMDPLNLSDEVASSGSEHSAHADADEADSSVSSLSLSDLVYGFFADDARTDESSSPYDSDSDRDSSVYDSVDGYDDLVKLKQVFNNGGDSAATDTYRNVLCANVNKAVDIFASVRTVTASQVRRSVMAYLRNLGYNAAVCKTKWDGSGGLTAGNYEFIDVLRSDPFNRITRYLIDLDFAKEFEIARPTSRYEHAVQSIPKVFVGKIEELKQILKVMSDAGRRSLKSRGLHLPPWRKHRYMQNKWLGPYKRTTNVFPSVTGTVYQHQPPLEQNFAVKCRSVGFDVNPANGRLLLFPAITRTR